MNLQICRPHHSGQKRGRMKTMLARTKRKTGPSKKQKPRTFTSQETDTIIAALRLWQRSPAYPEIEIAEEHGVMLDDNAIDDLIERINR
jgi:hypothetical protein